MNRLIKKYMTKEGYDLYRYSKHMIFRNHLLQKSITVSSTPKCEKQELKIVQVIVRRQKRLQQTITKRRTYLPDTS